MDSQKQESQMPFKDTLAYLKLYYQLASLEERVINTEVESIKSQITELEQEISLLKQGFETKVSECERLNQELCDERNYTAQILEESARQKLKYEIGQDVIATSNGVNGTNPEKITKVKKKGPFIFRRRKVSIKRARKGDIPDVAKVESIEDMAVSTTAVNGSPQQGENIPKKDVPTTVFPAPQNDTSSILKDTKNKTASPHEKRKISRSSSQKSHHQVPERKQPDSLSVSESFKTNKLMWYSHRCLPEGLHGSTLRVHDLAGRLYVCCGSMEDGLPNKGLFYCPIRNITRWARATPDVPQYHSASTILQNELVLIGGLSAVDGKCSGSIQSYDVKAQIWVERFPPLPTPRSFASAFVYAEYVVVAGGQEDNGTVLNVVEVLHIPSKTWETSTRLPISVAGHSLVVCGDKVYLIGGSGGTGFQQSVYVASVHKILSTCHRFAVFSNLAEMTTTSSPVWTQLQDCPFIKMSAVCSGNQLLAFGGEEITLSANAVAAEWIWIYNSEDNTWTPVQGMPSARKLCCVTVLPENKLIIIGGVPDYDRVDLAENV